ncbi:MAG: hypothetical protein ACXU8A_00180 [Burkholderiaceae bacterium]
MNELPGITAHKYASSSLSAGDISNTANALIGSALNNVFHQQLKQTDKKEITMATARIVKVFIADNNDNLPLEKRVMYSGEEKLTDLTDQELFFELPISDLLAKQNELRKTVVDKVQSEKFGRDIFLEPARIRDLKMVVVTVASF